MTESDKSMDMEEDKDNAVVRLENDFSYQDNCPGSQPSAGQGSTTEPTQQKQKEATDKDVIDLEKEPVKEGGRRQMATRSEWWDHFEKIRDAAGIVRSGKCNYCTRIIKA